MAARNFAFPDLVTLKALLVVLVAAVVIAVGVLTFLKVGRLTAGPQEDWPAFSALYTIEVVRIPQGETKTRLDTIVERLDYRSRTNWTRSVLTDSSDHSMTGAVHSYDGTRVIDDLPELSAPIVTVVPAGQLMLPVRWLALWDQAAGFAETEVDGGRLLRYEQVGQLQCSVSIEACESKVGLVTEVQRVTVDAASRIPVLVERIVDGRAAETITVTDLTLK